jgi:polysaccharide biosynthesis/export protein
MRKSFLTNIMLVILMLFLFSCVPLKNIYYLKENKKDSTNIGKKIHTPPIYTLRSGDMLYIKILSLDEKTMPLFNVIGSNYEFGMNEQLSMDLNSFVVSDSGYIVMPVFGKIYVDSLSINQAEEKIRTTIKSFISSADVIVKLLSFKITLVGEFAKPGSYTIYKNDLNIFEAIGLAGDLTIYGNKSKLMVVRQMENNKIYNIDLTDRTIIYSEAFYLQPNDILIAEPFKVKRQIIQNPTISAVSIFLTSMVNIIVLLRYFKL